MGGEEVSTAPAERHPELSPFVAAVRRVYGERLAGIYLFGSRARGDHRTDSDYDVAVVLRAPFKFWHEHARLADLAYDSMLVDEILIQPFPFSDHEWRAAERDLLKSAREVAMELRS
jgi:uncharacterized protein